MTKASVSRRTRNKAANAAASLVIFDFQMVSLETPPLGEDPFVIEYYIQWYGLCLCVRS